MNGYQDFVISNGTIPKSCCAASHSDCTPNRTYSLSCFQALTEMVNKKFSVVVIVGSVMAGVMFIVMFISSTLTRLLYYESRQRPAAAIS
jgi:hypothetical protein